MANLNHNLYVMKFPEFDIKATLRICNFEKEKKGQKSFK